MKNHYQILGIAPTSSLEEIKKAYKLYALKYHPDKQKGDVFFEERFKEINEAYQILSDEYKRKKYDNLFLINNINTKRLKDKEFELLKKEKDLIKKEQELNFKSKNSKSINNQVKNDKSKPKLNIIYSNRRIIITNHYIKSNNNIYTFDEYKNVYTITQRKNNQAKKFQIWVPLLIITIGYFTTSFTIGYFLIAWGILTILLQIINISIVNVISLIFWKRALYIEGKYGKQLIRTGNKFYLSKLEKHIKKGQSEYSNLYD